MEPEIIVISDSIEIHPNGRLWAVVRNGSVYGSYVGLGYALELADSLMEEEENAATPQDR